MAFSYYRSITIDRTKVPNTDQTNFAVLVSLTDNTLKSTGNGGNIQNSNGYDVYFYTDSALTTRIPAEREFYSATTGNYIGWTKVPTVSTSVDTVIYMAYGDASISTDPNSDATYGATNTWNSAFVAVYHLADGTTLSLTDSTSNAYTLTNNNSTTAGAGKVDGSTGTLNGTSMYLNNTSVAMGTASDITVSYWENQAAGNVQASGLWRFTTINGATRVQANSPWVDSVVYWDFGNTGGGRLSASYTSYVDKWTYVTLTGKGDNTAQKIYLDGAQVATQVNTGAPTGTYSSLEIGKTLSDYQKAAIDEFRVSNVVRGPDWIKTEYNNQNSPGNIGAASFYTVGAETSTGGGGAVAHNLSTLGAGS